MFFQWWDSLSTMSQIFYCIAVPATLVLLIQTVMILIGIGDEGDVSDISDSGDSFLGEDGLDEIMDAAGLESLRIFTLRGIIAFFVVFGWVGVVMEDAKVHIAITLSVATVSGFVIMVALAFLFRAVMKLRSDGNTDNRNAIGTSGKVYLTIPPSRSGVGKVQVILQGAFVERNAVTDETEAIPTDTEVVVVGVSGQIDLVVKRK